MTESEITHRLALIDGVEFSSAEREAIAKEIADNLRVVAELEEFCQETAWISHQSQPTGNKA
jgi:hypothetical protein